MTDRFDDPEPEFETFRADLPSRRPVSERTRMLVVGAVVGVLSTILAYVWLGAPSHTQAPPQSVAPAQGKGPADNGGRAGFYRGLAGDFAKAAR